MLPSWSATRRPFVTRPGTTELPCKRISIARAIRTSGRDGAIVGEYNHRGRRGEERTTGQTGLPPRGGGLGGEEAGCSPPSWLSVLQCSGGSSGGAKRSATDTEQTAWAMMGRPR